MRRLRPLPALAVAAGLLAGCAQAPKPTAGGPTRPVAPSEKQAETPAAPTVDLAALDPTRRRLAFAPDDLAGLDGAVLTALLGEPALIRIEPPAEVWQYRADGCVLDLVLYEERGAARLAYLSARATGARLTDAQACLDAVRDAHETALATPTG